MTKGSPKPPFFIIAPRGAPIKNRRIHEIAKVNFLCHSTLYLVCISFCIAVSSTLLKLILFALFVFCNARLRASSLRSTSVFSLESTITVLASVAILSFLAFNFGVPIGLWLKGPLKDWAEELLDESRLHSESFFYPHLVRKMWNEHLSGTRNWQYQLWSLLMFQAWLEDNS